MKATIMLLCAGVFISPVCMDFFQTQRVITITPEGFKGSIAARVRYAQGPACYLNLEVTQESKTLVLEAEGARRKIRRNNAVVLEFVFGERDWSGTKVSLAAQETIVTPLSRTEIDLYRGLLGESTGAYNRFCYAGLTNEKQLSPLESQSLERLAKMMLAATDH